MKYKTYNSHNMNDKSSGLPLIGVVHPPSPQHIAYFIDLFSFILVTNRAALTAYICTYFMCLYII